MEQDQEDRGRVPVEEWEEAGEDAAGKVVWGLARAATASAPNVGKKRRIKWDRPAMSSGVPSVGPR